MLIEDIIYPDKTTKQVTWQFITQADARIVKEGVELNQDGQQLKLNNLSHPDIEFKIVSLDPPPHKLDKQIDNLKRIELRIPVESLDVNNISIKVRLEGQ